MEVPPRFVIFKVDTSWFWAEPFELDRHGPFATINDATAAAESELGVVQPTISQPPARATGG